MSVASPGESGRRASDAQFDLSALAQRGTPGVRPSRPIYGHLRAVNYKVANGMSLSKHDVHAYAAASQLGRQAGRTVRQCAKN